MEKIRVNFSGPGDRPLEELVTRAAGLAFGQFELPFLAQVDIALADENEIRQINREYRDVDRVTDVLSFPMEEFDRGTPLVEPVPAPDTGRVFLGDVLLCAQRAREQAAQYGHSFERECAYLTVHSMLHLLGFDHEDEGPQKAEMRRQEEAVMQKLGLERDQ